MGKGSLSWEYRAPVLAIRVCCYSDPFLLQFVAVYLEFMLFVNLVCIIHRCGKTTICQVFADLANQKLYSVNCHLHMETSDFLGGLRPVRQKTKDKVCPVANEYMCSFI